MKVLSEHTVKLFKLVGNWPLETKNSKMLFVYKIYFYITVMIYLSLTVSAWLELPNCVRSGLKTLVNCLSIDVQLAEYAIKLLCLSLPLMRRLYQEATAIEADILNCKSDSVKAIYKKYIKMNIILCNGFFVVTLANGFVFVITLFVMKMSSSDNDEPLELPVPLCFPFNYRENYEIALGLTLIGVLVATVYVTACNLLYLGWMVFIISQLAILKQDIVEGIDTKKYGDEEIYQNLRHFSMRYRNVSKLLTDFNKVLKFLNLLYFLLCIGHTSMIGFQVITDDFSVQLLKNILYLGSTLVVELVTWYWFGTKITSEHSAIVDAIWESDWYNCNIKNKKAILIIMMQVRKPLSLSVGYSYSVSLQTMTKILKTSMSYTFALKQFDAMKK